MESRRGAERPDLHQARLLIIDDEDVNIRLLQSILRGAGFQRLDGTTRPEEAVGRFLEFRPDLVCLDLNMPGLSGFDVLGQLVPLIEPGTVLPILMLTGDSSLASRQRALALGATDFVVKPFDIEEVLLRIRNLLLPRFLHLELQEHNRRLEVRVVERTRALEDARLEVLERLARAAEFRDDDTGQHTRRVGRIAALLAEALGWHGEDVEIIGRAAPLHDLGKIGVPDPVLLKPGRLTPDETRVMQRHTTVGAEILGGGRTPLIQAAAEIALSHHERWDGGGYPAGLAGEAIPESARIVALADVFDALTHARPYRDAWPLPRVLDHLAEEAGRHFEPRLCERFLTLPLGELL